MRSYRQHGCKAPCSLNMGRLYLYLYLHINATLNVGLFFIVFMLSAQQHDSKLCPYISLEKFSKLFIRGKCKKLKSHIDSLEFFKFAIPDDDTTEGLQLT
jgi:hypothetical protein